MDITCPACRKLNVVGEDGLETACTRCGCELDQLAAIARAAHSQLLDACAALRAGDRQLALEQATRSWSLCRSSGAAAAAAIAAACNGDAVALDRWRYRWEASGT